MASQGVTTVTNKIFVAAWSASVLDLSAEDKKTTAKAMFSRVSCDSRYRKGEVKVSEDDVSLGLPEHVHFRLPYLQGRALDPSVKYESYALSRAPVCSMEQKKKKADAKSKAKSNVDSVDLPDCISELLGGTHATKIAKGLVNAPKMTLEQVKALRTEAKENRNVAHLLK